MRPTDPIEPDPVIETALRLLPIPAHGETFWDDLDRALVGPAAAESPVFVLPDRTDQRPLPSPVHLGGGVDDALALVPLALRRRSNAVVVAVAAAAVVLVVLAGSSLVSEQGDEPLEVANASTGNSSSALNALVDDAHPASATPVTLSATHEAASTDAVAAWVDAVHEGDAEAAWSAMGPASQDHFGSQAAFEDQLADLDSALGEWSAVNPTEVMVTPVLSSDDGTLAVVTLVGATDAVDESSLEAHAFPVWILDGDVVLEPFAPAGELELVVPEPLSDSGTRAIVEHGDELVIVVPQGVEAPVLRLDDGDTVVCGEADGTELRAMDDLPMQRCSYLPTTGITPGEHTLTVAFLGADGASISADALLFEAA